MTSYRAAWILPISQPPCRDACVTISNGRIVSVGPASACRSERIIDLGRVAVLPGLVNAHTHLELSWMQGRVPRADSMPAWARRVIDLRARGRPLSWDQASPWSVGGTPETKPTASAKATASLAEARFARRRKPGSTSDADAIRAAIRQARASGTALIGDVGNTLVSVGPLEHSGLNAVVFRELIGFNPESAAALVDKAVAEVNAAAATERVRITLAAHAPYSVAPAVFGELRRALDRWPDRPTTVHVGESNEEVEFLTAGTGPWRHILEDVGAWDPAWRPPACGPVEYLERLGFVGPRVLAVHGVHLSEGDLARLRAVGATLVTCPRSNAWTGAGAAPIERFYASGVRVAIGTDSLASAPDLNVFSELAAMRRLAPGVRARRFLESATGQGAAALGFDAELGTIEAGKRAALVAVSLREDVADVEEYLVSGVAAADIRWLDARS